MVDGEQYERVEEKLLRANLVIKRMRILLEDIVIPEGEDAGVILKSSESPTKYDHELKCHVYTHEHFSELGNALVELHRICVPVK